MNASAAHIKPTLPYASLPLSNAPPARQNRSDEKIDMTPQKPLSSVIKSAKWSALDIRNWVEERSASVQCLKVESLVDETSGNSFTKEAGRRFILDH